MLRNATLSKSWNRKECRLSLCILITIENYDDSDISLESEFDSVSITKLDNNSQDKNLKLERDKYYNEYCDKYKNQAWNSETQIQAQLKDRQLAQLYNEIKAWAKTPDPAYQKLP
jgi:hypothetical protein